MHRRKDIVTWKKFAMNRNLPQVEQASRSTNSSSLPSPPSRARNTSDTAFLLLQYDATAQFLKTEALVTQARRITNLKQAPASRQ
ncbi:hypothetical protein QC761_0064030 [Podospora bellae-mahoneyi]|uniref:Uncharacterized protein n=1 Tax=Podospora bellae-mahoneyi TaxID=2093777 RepID=A0ABR0FH01_9PEZI|nr:hypothetical protein QC761_0064030 [Podospora bellae-mahoneyi]